MTSAIDVEQRLNKILHESAKKLNLVNYTLNLNLNVLKGDGYLGEFYKASLTDEDSKQEIKLAIKKAPQGEKQREQMHIEDVYRNEITFYSVVYPALQQFEKQHQTPEPFDAIPAYITSVGKVGEEIIVFKDITADGFELREKDLQLDDEHASFIFKTYGHFHGISFCLKEQKPEEFQKMTEPLVNALKKFNEDEGFTTYVRSIVEESYESLDRAEDAPVKEKFKKYVDNITEIFGEAIEYRGSYSGFLHGDCWSNNMMFRYQNPETKSKLEALNLLDFQVVRVGTPVYDLSYFFYTGAPKKLLDKLEYYLDIYHNSFSKTAKNLGCDPEKLLPRDKLSEDWKIYGKMGMVMGLMLTKVKLISKEDSIDMINRLNDEDIDKVFQVNKYDKDIFKQRARDLILHMYEIDAL